LSYWDDFFEFKESLRDLETLVEKMNHSLTRNLIVKGHPANNSSIINVTSYLRDKFPEIKFIESGIPIEKLYKFSKMFIHTYDSTAMIKTLYQNIPTLAFWRNDLSHVSFKFKSLYEELVSLGILHFSPLSLLSKLEILQNDIDYWWYSEDVQKARKNFLNSLANNPRSPIRSLRKILLEK
jgi:putative transferase (TIGR04331 family)